MKLVEMLADQVDYLRAKLEQRPYVNPATTPALNPSGLEPTEPGQLSYLTEEEEDILALREFDHLTDSDVEHLRQQLGLERLTN